MFDFVSFLVGFILATTLGIISQQILQLGGAVNAPNRPMSTFPDAAQPHLTSRGIVSAGYQALFRRFLYTLLLWVVIGTSGWLIWQWISSLGFTMFGQPACP